MIHESDQLFQQIIEEVVPETNDGRNRWGYDFHYDYYLEEQKTTLKLYGVISVSLAGQNV